MSCLEQHYCLECVKLNIILGKQLTGITHPPFGGNVSFTTCTAIVNHKSKTTACGLHFSLLYMLTNVIGFDVDLKHSTRYTEWHNGIEGRVCDSIETKLQNI